ncbi:F0F1 ATP synthase subunit B [Nocardia arthritidis]|uniref:ATP synthase subunit b n=1 Tax=Nocardia arthritidis TaxID=228602 RepID=A0A6G9YPE8_9NOCA|nr:F0F1 ATP synthase subunit B [Nocardia arthritidis]QIS14957.1 F0F1 ATP synthase subunit B [Nocardia arthritidis]
MSARTDVEAQGNFLIPNGTFFAELLIFLIVLGIIWFFVVPPIRKVLAERDNRIAETAVENKEARRLFAEATERYQKGLEQARTEAAAIRNKARAEGQAIIDELRAEAQAESDAIVAETTARLRAEADQIDRELRESVEPLAQSIADRIVGVDDRHAGTSPGHQTGRSSS